MARSHKFFRRLNQCVIPAKAGIHGKAADGLSRAEQTYKWIPAFAGMTRVGAHFLLLTTILILTACETMPRGGGTIETDTITQPTTAPQPTTATPVRVALLLPLTGANAALGQSMLNAAQMALFDTGFENFELLPIDTGGTAQGAASAANNAVQQGARLILGPVFADEVRAVAPAARAADINVIGFSTNWELAGGGTYIMGFMPFDQIEHAVNYAAKTGIKRIGSIAPQSQYGRAVMPAFESASSRAGLKPADTIAISPETPAAFTAIQDFARRNAGQMDAVFMPFGGGAAGAVASALSIGGLPQNIRRIGTGLMDDDALAANPALQGTIFAAPSPRLRRSFEQKFEATYGTRPPRLASLAYDSTALAGALAARGGINNTNAFGTDAITNPNGFSGLDGIFRFRSDGRVERGLAILEYRNGRITVIQESPATFQR
jgi:branched-chain amino acid transport system substrate-binding protein